MTGDVECEVKDASENELQCILQAKQKTHIVTNQGSDDSRFKFPYVGFGRCQTESIYSKTDVVLLKLLQGRKWS